MGPSRVDKCALEFPLLSMTERGIISSSSVYDQATTYYRGSCLFYQVLSIAIIMA